MTKIAFTSCARWRANAPQVEWAKIQACDPDLLVLLGDNIYTGPNGDYSEEGWQPDFDEKYTNQLNDPFFQDLTKRVPFLAIWDDHDFGHNNALGGIPGSKAQEFSDEALDAFDKYMWSRITAQPALAASLDRPVSEGNYYSVIFNDIKFILLDVRTFRMAEGDDRNEYSLLGKIQTEWFLKNLDHTDATFTIVCSGSTLQNRKGKSFETVQRHPAFWELFKARFGKMSGVPNPIFLGGDIHANDIKSYGQKWGVFHEAISSGITLLRKSGQELANFGLITIEDDTTKIETFGNKRRDYKMTLIDNKTWLKLTSYVAPKKAKKKRKKKK